jgi:hypothetical protein
MFAKAKVSIQGEHMWMLGIQQMLTLYENAPASQENRRFF